ncbi:MAG TPA: diguanylate cyclase, partial [Lachnospiraceae bacterium]|nr:diguanylate cyclase [Lachnospiraceae bacterium]
EENGNIVVMRNNEETKGRTRYYSVKSDLTAGDLVMETDKYDPRERAWYRTAKEAGAPIFSPIFKHFVLNETCVSATWPIYSEDSTLIGVLGAHMLLSNIDDYLSEHVESMNGYALIIEKDTGELVANSIGVDDFTVIEDGSLQRNTVNNLESVALRKAYEHYEADSDTQFLYEDSTDSLYVNVEEYTREGLNWVILSAIPSSQLMGEINRNISLTILLVVLAVILSSIIYYIITRKLFMPINKLIEATNQLSQGDLSKRVEIVRNDEIGKITNSFNRMADKMYQLVNNLEIRVKERTSEIEKTNEELVRAKEDLYLILDSTAEGIYGIDLEGNCTFCNASCLKILGYTNVGDLLGKNMHWLIHHSDRSGTTIQLEDCYILNTILTGERAHDENDIFWRADGTSFDVEYHSYPQYKAGKLIGAVITFIDITERKKGEEQIRYLSEHDSLTGLMNRRYFDEALRKYDVKSNLPITIIYADLNKLKLVNDIFGHASGDLLIKKSADILKKTCRNEDIIARVGGDEFIIMLLRTEQKDAERIISRIKTELAKEKVNAVKCSMSLGCDTKISSYQDIEEVMGNAEREMYQEKLRSRKSFGADTIDTIMNTLQEESPRQKQHSENVAFLCRMMGKALGLPEPEIKKLSDAGYLHDIGKIVLDANLLTKLNLNESEKQFVQQHPIVGFKILNLFDDTLDLAGGVYAHHEKWDGSGYPKGLKGEEIPIISRIIALAESYEQFVLEESGKEQWMENIIERLQRKAGKELDPYLVEIFIKLLREESLILHPKQATN